MILRTAVSAALVLSLVGGVHAASAEGAEPAALVEQSLRADGIDGALRTLRELAAESPETLAAAERALVGLAERLLAEERPVAAGELLTLYVELAPGAVRAHRTLGQACLARGDDAGAERHARAFLDARARAAFERIVAAEGDGLPKTAEQVLERAIAAMGGHEAFAALETLRMTSSGFQPAGPYGATRLLAAPHTVRQERRGRAIVTDGRSVWSVSNGAWQKISNPRWQRSLDLSLDLVDPAGKGVAYEYVGLEALEGAALHKLKKTHADGAVTHVYFDVATGLLFMEEDRLLGARSAMLYYDYRNVAGVKLPHLRIRIDPAMRAPHVAHLSYVANEDLDPALLTPPGEDSGR